MLDDQEALLTLEIETIHGHLSSLSGGIKRLTRDGAAFVFAWGTTSSVLAAAELYVTLIDGVGWQDHTAYGPDLIPEAVTILAERLRRMRDGDDVAVDGGPSFTFPARFSTVVDSYLPIASLDDPKLGWTNRLVRPGNWQDWEWDDLMAGRQGPWSMAVDGDDPVAICHTPAATEHSAEAGVWSAPDYRRRGLATAVVRDWYRQERDRRPVLYYSTFRDNTASRAVARALDLTPLGWMWTVR